MTVREEPPEQLGETPRRDDRCIEVVEPAMLMEGVTVKHAQGPSSPPSDQRQPKGGVRYAGGYFLQKKDGLYFIEKDDKGERPQWICSPIIVAATTRDNKSGEWGRLLRWSDDDGMPHQWAMPLELLQGDGLSVRQELSSQGLRITPARKGRDLLSVYLQIAPAETKARCVGKLGWQGGQFVTPARSIGEGEGELVVFQSSHAIEPAFSTGGSLKDWQDTIGKLSADNSRLQLAICVALAGPVAEMVGEDSGGFHLRGTSSTGKSTAQHVCCSVWGSPATFKRSWRATSNGLEGIAAIHNDLVLVLDELSQCEPKQAGDAAYMLANGQGKARAGRNGNARQSASWRLLFLSSGEVSLSSLLAGVGQRVNAGQEVRLADIAADAGKGLGLFECLHGYSTANALAVALNDQTSRYHGVVGQEWLELLVANRDVIANAAAEPIEAFVAENTTPKSSGQVLRVARRFGLVAYAGELAIQMGLLQWNEGAAGKAIATCFMAWLDDFGNGSREDAALTQQVRLFVEQHGASRFQTMKGEERVINRAGYLRINSKGCPEYLVLPEVFKAEVCKGFDPVRAAKVLDEAGLLIKGNGRTQQAVRIGEEVVRCYVLSGAALSEGGER